MSTTDPCIVFFFNPIEHPIFRGHDRHIWRLIKDWECTRGKFEI